MMRQPAGPVSGSFTSGTNTQTLRVAPGAGFSYRVVWISIAIGRTATTTLNISWRDSSPQVSFEMQLDPAVIQNHDFVFPLPGWLLAENAALQIVQNASVAGDSVRWAVGMFTETL